MTGLRLPLCASAQPSVTASRLGAFLLCPLSQWRARAKGDGLLFSPLLLSFVAHDNVLQPFHSTSDLGFRVKDCFSWLWLTDLKKDRINELVGGRKIRHLPHGPFINERNI